MSAFMLHILQTSDEVRDTAETETDTDHCRPGTENRSASAALSG